MSYYVCKQSSSSYTKVCKGLLIEINSTSSLASLFVLCSLFCNALGNSHL